MKNEKIMEDEISFLKKEVEKVKKEKDDISQKMILTLKQIHNDEMEISFLNSDEFFHKLISERLENHNIQIEERKSQFSIAPSKKSFNPKKKNKKENDSFYLKTLQLKEQTTRNQKKKEVEETIKLNLEKLKNYKLDFEKLKEEHKKKKIILDSKIKFLSDYYHKKLYEGLDIRNEGLIWIMKAIWNLDQEIILSFFPNFLDQTSIDYLFEVAHRSVEINKIKNEIQTYRKELDYQFEIINKQNKFDNQRTLFRTSIQGKLNSKSLPKIKLNQIQIAEKNINQSNVTIKNIGSVLNEKNPYSKILENPIIQKISDLAAQSSEIEYEIIQMKRKELNRLFKEFFINDYQNKFHVVIETVIGALVGEKKKLKKKINLKKKKIIKNKMKRTKDRFGKYEYYNDHNISGLKVFDGEDLEYQDRMRLQTLQQNAWIQQQKYENEIKAQQERDEERRYAEQTLAINRMRSMLEAEHEQKIRDMNCLTSNYNRKLSQMKREKDAKDKYDEDQLDQYNIQDAEDTRNRAYAHMKEEIDQAVSEI